MTQPAQDNAAQIDFWNGLTGEKWVRNQELVDRAFTPLTTALLGAASAAPGEAAIDVGCGCGDITLALARSLGSDGNVLAVDVSTPMLAHAQSRAQRLSAPHAAIQWTLADATAYSFADAPADLIVSRFGVMFFADPLAAFTNLRRGLKPGGRLAMLCWRPMAENAWVAVPRTAVLPLVPPPEPMEPHAPGPFAFADPERITGILAKAGFAQARAEPVNADLIVGIGPDAVNEAASYSLQVGPTGSLLREASEATVAAAREAVTETLRAHLRDGAVSLGAACWLYTARAE